MVYIQVMGANPYSVFWHTPGSSGLVHVTYPLGARDSMESILNAAGWASDPHLGGMAARLSFLTSGAVERLARLRVNLVY